MTLYTLSTAATSYPVSINEVRANARIDTNDEDALIAGYLAAATEAVEEMTGKRLISQTWLRKSAGASGKILIDKPPVQSITSMSYQDGDDATQTLTVSNFYTYSDEDRFWVEPKANTEWPTFYDRDDALTITFVTGYGDDPADVPEVLRQAIILLACHWIDTRAAVSEVKMMPVPMGVEMLVGLRRTRWVA